MKIESFKDFENINDFENQHGCFKADKAIKFIVFHHITTLYHLSPPLSPPKRQILKPPYFQYPWSHEESKMNASFKLIASSL